MIKERSWKKVLVLHSTDSATMYEVTKVLAPRLKANGVNATIDTFAVGQRDFKTLCAKYAGKKWDGVVYNGFGSELPFVGEACSAYPNISKAPKLSGCAMLDVKPDLRGNLTGIQFYTPAFLAKTSPEYENFSKRYVERFPGMSSTYAAVYAYDAYLLLADALIKQSTTNPNTIKAELMNSKKMLAQEYKFDQNGDFQPDTLLVELSIDGTFKPVKAETK